MILQTEAVVIVKTSHLSLNPGVSRIKVTGMLVVSSWKLYILVSLGKFGTESHLVCIKKFSKSFSIVSFKV